MTKFLKKFLKNYFGVILDAFSQNVGKNEFSWKKRTLSVFKYSNYLPSCKKKKKTEKNWWPIPEKNPELTNKLTDGQTDNGDFIRPPVGRAPKSYQPFTLVKNDVDIYSAS